MPKYIVELKGKALWSEHIPMQFANHLDAARTYKSYVVRGNQFGGIEYIKFSTDDGKVKGTIAERRWQ